jgi:ubiquinone/menaquinone biosynthesis C-methylase UbiE
MSNHTGSPGPLAQPLAWDLVADGYAEELAPVLEGVAERALEVGRVTRGTRVLDVASGPGTLALRAAARGANVTAVDFSPAMISRLQKRAAAGAVDVHAVVGDGQALELADGAFDAAFSLFGVIFFPDRTRGLRELARVLSTGGRAVVTSWPPTERVPVFATVFSSLRSRMPQLALGGGRAPLGDPDDIRVELRDAGFADVQVEEVPVTYDFASMADAWRSMSRSTAPLALLRHKLGPGPAGALEGEILNDLIARFGPGPVRIDGTAFLSSGRRAH